MDTQLLKKFNEQMNHELYAAYLYLSISAYFESLSFRGLAKWMRHHAEEELKHAMKIYDHLIDRDLKVEFPSIAGVENNWKTPYEAVNAAFLHEKKVTKLINDLYHLAKEVKDPAAEQFLHWFIEEQVEEEDVTRTMSERVKLAGDNSAALLIIDSEAGKQEDHD